MRRLILGLIAVLFAAACGGDGELSPSSLPASITPGASEVTTVTVTSGFTGPTNTTPPSLGDSLTLPLPEGFGVVCAGSTGDEVAKFARLEGPWTEGPDFDGVAGFYEAFLEREDFSVLRVVNTPRYLVLDGTWAAPEGGLVSATIRPTVHSTTVVAAYAVDRAAFGLAGDAMDTTPSCWSGSELHDAASQGYFEAVEHFDGGTDSNVTGNNEEPTPLPDQLLFSGINANLWRGPGHCDWDGTWFMEIRDEAFEVETDSAFPVYVRDPDEMASFTYAADSAHDATVPAAATMISRSPGGYELWFDATDETRLYLVTPDRVEAWALALDYHGCI